MPYIFKGMYISPLPASDTDGDRNIQAPGNRFLWCCFPMRCTLLTVWVSHAGDGQDPSERPSCSLLPAAFQYSTHHLFVWASRRGNIAFVWNNSAWWTGWVGPVRLLFITLHPHGKARLSTDLTHIMEPLHLHLSSFHRRVRGRMLHWQRFSLALALFLDCSLDPKASAFSGIKKIKN